VPEARALKEMLAKAASRFNSIQKNAGVLQKTHSGVLDRTGLMYACSAGQLAGDDDQKGGFYASQALPA
jgi:hypothetical protein